MGGALRDPSAVAVRSGATRLSLARGFTLLELMIALVILSLVTATIYMSLSGALDSIGRVRDAQEPYQRGRVARSFLTSSLRSTALFSGLPEDGFVAVDSSHGGIPRDELTFISLAPPGAETSRMQLHLYVTDSAGASVLKLGVRPVGVRDSLPPYEEYTLSEGIRGLDITYLAAAADDRTTWVEHWDSRIRVPHALRMTFLPSQRPDPVWLAPLVVQIPSGRIF
jgi:prepilin-type N-terminal cleavage/methylation domain-containing protein